MSDINHTLQERGARYGDFRYNARIAQEIKITMRRGLRWDALQPDMKEALDQIACKISRLLSGDPAYPDNWHDISGYATLVAQTLKSEDDDA